MVANKLVVVALVEVEFKAVKFWRVDEAFNKRLERLVKPPVAVRVVPIASEPVKLAVAEIVWPLIKPAVIGPAVKVPMLPLVAKRFVDEPVVVKKLVVVALRAVRIEVKKVVEVELVEVELRPVKF